MVLYSYQKQGEQRKRKETARLPGRRVRQQRPGTAEDFGGNANDPYTNLFLSDTSRRKESPMTIHEVSSQIFNLTLGGFVNGEKFTKQELEHVFHVWMEVHDPSHNKVPGSHLIELCLRDGRWFATIDKFADRHDGFDYYIPDTREEESRLLAKFTT